MITIVTFTFFFYQRNEYEDCISLSFNDIYLSGIISSSSLSGSSTSLLTSVSCVGLLVVDCDL